MRSEFEVFLSRLFNFGEDDAPVPEATPDNLPTLIQNQDWLVELLDAPVDLIDAVLHANRIEFEFAIPTKAEWCVRVQVMSSW